MPRSNSSFGVADGGKVASAGPRGGGAPPGATAFGFSRLSGSPAARPPGAIDRPDRGRTATEYPRRAGSIRILVGIEGVAAGAAAGRRRLLHDRGWRGDLRLIGRRPALWMGLRAGRIGGLPLRRVRLALGRILLRRGCGGDIGLGLTGRLRAALQHPQPVFELPVAVLQFLVLAGELPQLIRKLLDPRFRIVGHLRQSGRRQRCRNQSQKRGERRGTGQLMKAG